MRPRVFYLYNERSKSDAKLCQNLEAWMYSLYRDERQTTRWHRVPPGADLHLEQLQRMQEADVILLLLTAEFLSDDECHQFTLAALSERERAAIVIPILLRPIADSSMALLGGLQLLPRNGVPISKWRSKDDAWQHICGEIRSVLERSTLRSVRRPHHDAGTSFGQYRLVGRLASSGNSDVFEAEHSVIGRRAAVKVARPHVDADFALQTMRREVRALEAAIHPGVVALYDAGSLPEGLPYIAMEFIDGTPISRTAFVSGPHPPPWRQVLTAARQIAQTVSALHSRGLFHCDLKPTNVLLVRRDGLTRHRFDTAIIDFGTARIRDAVSVEQQERAFIGTPGYMAPEQMTSPETIDGKADVYAFGVLLFELFTGQLPFCEFSPPDMLRQRVAEPARALASLEPNIDTELQQLVGGMLSMRASSRPTMSEVAEALRVSLQTCGDSLMTPIAEDVIDGDHAMSNGNRPMLDLDTLPAP